MVEYLKIYGDMISLGGGPFLRSSGAQGLEVCVEGFWLLNRKTIKKRFLGIESSTRE